MWHQALRDGVVLTRELEAAGWSRVGVQRLTRQGELVPLMRGAFRAPGDLDAAGEYRLRTIAAWRLAPSPMVLSHATALAFAGLPVDPGDLNHVHLMHVRAGTSRRSRLVMKHANSLGVLTRPGSTPGEPPTVSIADALVQAGCWRPGLNLLTSGDAAMFAGLVSVTDLTAAVARHVRHRRIGQVRALVERFDPRHESPGETRLADVMRQLGWASTPQVQIQAGGRRFRVDRLLDDVPVIVEFDGRVKYDGPQGSQALFDEKVREDALRAQGFEFVRITWRQLGNPTEVHRLLLAAVNRARHRAA